MMASATPTASSQNRIVVLGGGGVGKSALTIRFVTKNYVKDYDPTIEDSYQKQVKIDDQMMMLNILDTAGQEEFVALQDQWMRQGKGFMLVYDLTNRSTFDEVALLYDKVLRAKDKDKVPLVLVANKCDLEAHRAVPRSAGEQLAAKWGCPFYETSAKELINNETCFIDLVREMIKDNPQEKKPVKKAFWESCCVM